MLGPVDLFRVGEDDAEDVALEVAGARHDVDDGPSWEPSWETGGVAILPLPLTAARWPKERVRGPDGP